MPVLLGVTVALEAVAVKAQVPAETRFPSIFPTCFPSLSW